jgi:hypothetical protein
LPTASTGLATPGEGRLLTGMEKFDAQIGWLYEQTAHAQKALADLKSGDHNIEIDGEDQTQELVET